MKSKLKLFNISLCVALVCSILLSLVSFDASCEELRQNVLKKQLDHPEDLQAMLALMA